MNRMLDGEFIQAVAGELLHVQFYVQLALPGNRIGEDIGYAFDLGERGLDFGGFRLEDLQIGTEELGDDLSAGAGDHVIDFVLDRKRNFRGYTRVSFDAIAYLVLEVFAGFAGSPLTRWLQSCGDTDVIGLMDMG